MICSPSISNSAEHCEAISSQNTETVVEGTNCGIIEILN